MLNACKKGSVMSGIVGEGAEASACTLPAVMVSFTISLGFLVMFFYLLESI
jgi:hypothetical protein